MERAFKQYVDEITSEIAALVYSDGEGAMYEDKFTEYCFIRPSKFNWWD